ncbi:MAG: OmpA family protein [Flavobacteriales bacterium]
MSTDNQRAIKKFKKAINKYRIGKKEKAAKYLKKALNKDDEFIEAYTVLGDIYKDTEKFERSLKNYKKAIDIDPKVIPENYYKMGRIEMRRKNYETAAKYFKNYLDLPNKREMFIPKAKSKLKSVEFAKKAVKNPVDFNPVNMGKNINSKYNEYFPCLTVDKKTLLYTRKIDDKKAYGGTQEDFYFSKKRNGKWQKAINLTKPVNSLLNEGAPTLSPDGQLLIFTGCELHGSYGKNRRGLGSCDLFVSKKKGDKWSRPQNFGRPINSRNWETQPSFSSDGRTLYFVRGKMTKQGIKDQNILVTRLKDDNSWTKPTKLGDNINTSGREASVFIHPDNRTLYFSSSGHPGMGGLDIFVSRKDSSGDWKAPMNLGYPINTASDENSLLVSPDGKKAYFASDRDSGYGELDLYSFTLPKKTRAKSVTYMKGKVYDSETKKPLEAEFELIDLETGQQVVRSKSNPKTGEFIVTLPTNRDYALNVSNEGYLFFSENFTLKGQHKQKDPYKKDIPLVPIKKGKSIVLKNVFFETAKYNLKPRSKAELDKLVKFLEKNPNIKIQLSGHTDKVGKEKDNQILSENRAQSVVDYLIKNGIDKNRLTAKGFGEKKPIATNETEKGRAKNRRTEFKIIEK